MSEGAVFSIGAQRFKGHLVIRISRIFPRILMRFTELTLISARMIKLFDLVMRVGAVWIKAAFLPNFLTLDMIVSLEIGPAIIILVVIEETEILIMRV